MKKLFRCMAAILLLVSCSPNSDEKKSPEKIELLTFVKTPHHKEVEITDLRNGEQTILKDPNDINALLNMLKGIELIKSDDLQAVKGGSTFALQFKKKHVSLSAYTVMIEGVPYNSIRPIPVDQITENFFNPHEASP